MTALDPHEAIMAEREVRQERGWPISRPEHCWPHRFFPEGLRGMRCRDCMGWKCAEDGCQHLATEEDMCPEHQAMHEGEA